MSQSKWIRKTTTWKGKRYEVRALTEEEAIEKLAILKDQLKRGMKSGRETMTVNDWFAEWLELYKQPAGLTAKSLTMYKEKYNGYIRPRIGPMKLKDVTETHLQRILNDQAGKSFSHVSKLRLVMKAIFSRAHASHLIIWDPSEKLDLPRTTKGIRRSLTEEERAHFLAVAETHRAGLWVLTMLYAGLRPGETAVLQWKDVDFAANELHIHKALESGTDTVKGPKTAAGHRDIPMHPELRKRLLAAKGEPFQPVFTNVNGKPLTANGMQRLWHSFIRAVDLHMGAKTYRSQIVQSVVADDLTAYCLRHTFCTDLQRAGVPINVAKELMGHADIQTTANIYTHKDQTVLHQNVEKLANVGRPTFSPWDNAETH